MKLKYQGLLSGLTILLITGCPNKMEKPVDNSQKQATFPSTKNIDNKAVISVDKKKQFKRNTLYINDNKFFVDSLPLIAGKIVYDISTQEPGTVTNQVFVYFSKKIDTGSLDWPSDTQINFVAGKTYIVTAKSKNRDMLELYNELKNKTWATKVEMRIDYSPTQHRETF